MNGNEEDPFKEYLISDDWIKLKDTDKRDICPKCSKSRKYFCYTCFIPMNEFQDITPKVKLPVSIDIIKHPREIDGKSTAVHAAIICPEDVNVYVYPAIPNYPDLEETILIFPGKDALTLDAAIEKFSDSKNLESKEKPFSKVVFIDSTWNQCRTILNDSRIKKLTKIVLEKRASQFWRNQKGSPRTHLATIEAIHQFTLEYHHIMEPKVEYSGQYDNILFFFKFMYFKIHSLYDHEELLSYKRPML